jgi:hypothetical protein
MTKKHKTALICFLIGKIIIIGSILSLVAYAIKPEIEFFMYINTGIGGLFILFSILICLLWEEE